MEYDSEIFICECHSIEHQLVINKDPFPDETQIYVQIHLNKRSFFQRLKYGLLYILGRKCNYGAFDEFIFNSDDANKLQNIVNYLKRNNGK